MLSSFSQIYVWVEDSGISQWDSRRPIGSDCRGTPSPLQKSYSLQPVRNKRIGRDCHTSPCTNGWYGGNIMDIDRYWLEHFIRGFPFGSPEDRGMETFHRQNIHEKNSSHEEISWKGHHSRGLHKKGYDAGGLLGRSRLQTTKHATVGWLTTLPRRASIGLHDHKLQRCTQAIKRRIWVIIALIFTSPEKFNLCRESCTDSIFGFASWKSNRKRNARYAFGISPPTAKSLLPLEETAPSIITVLKIGAACYIKFYCVDISGKGAWCTN